MLSGAVRDLWEHRDLGTFSSLQFLLEGGGASRTFRLTMVEPLPWNVGVSREL